MVLDVFMIVFCGMGDFIMILLFIGMFGVGDVILIWFVKVFFCGNGDMFIMLILLGDDDGVNGGVVRYFVCIYIC